MKRIIFTPFFLIAFYLGTLAQTTHTINISGLTFSPSNLAISVGDKVVFNGSSNHPIAEVSMSTWDANGNTVLAGGFSFPSGVGEKTFNTEGTYYYICQNHISSGMKGKITVSAVTSINGQNFSEGINIFPNPLKSDFLTISFNKNPSAEIEIVIFDITGKSIIVKSEILDNNQVIIDCSHLLSGLYILQVDINNYVSTKKFVKK